MDGIHVWSDIGETEVGVDAKFFIQLRPSYSDAASTTCSSRDMSGSDWFDCCSKRKGLPSVWAHVVIVAQCPDMVHRFIVVRVASFVFVCVGVPRAGDS